MTKTTTIGIAAIVLAALLLAGCGSSDDEQSGSATTSSTTTAAPTSTSAPPETTTTPPADNATPADPAADLAGVLESWAQRGDIPGVIARIDGPDGLIWEGARGQTAFEQGEPLSVDHPFRIGSISKTITATAALQLTEDGLVDLDASIDHYLPAELVDRVHVTAGVSRGDDVTVRHLLGHTSGIHDYVTDPSFVPDVLADPGRSWTHDDIIDYAITHGDPHFAPGEGFHYSDTGYRLLGLIIEEVTGQPLHDAYRDLIFDPLGMDDTYLEGFEPARGLPLSHPYIGDVDALTIHHTVDWSGGGLVSTTADLAAFMDALTSGELFTEPSTLEDMTAFHVTETGPNYELLYGLGWLGFRSGDFEMAGHDGFWGSFMYTAPAIGVTLTGTVNQADANQLDLVFALLDALQP